jgi:predicted transcriptional regulator
MPGKRVQFDDETWQAVDVLARDSMKSFQELADEAFSDLLKKHGRPTDLKSALRQSAEQGRVGEPRGKRLLVRKPEKLREKKGQED